MTEGGPLHLQSNFFGADEAITNFEPGKDPWVATLIFSGTNRHQARDKRNRCIAEIVRQLEIKEVIDPQPDVTSGLKSGQLNRKRNFGLAGSQTSIKKRISNIE
jgi:pyrrolysine biosynthesis protein PylC